MRIVCFADAEGCSAVGIETDAGVTPTGYADLATFIADGPDAHERAYARAWAGDVLTTDPPRLAPVAAGAQLLYAGGNYTDHLAETGLHPTQPVFFGKLRSAVTGPGAPIRIPAPQTHCDWEAELCVVFGREARQVRAADAYDHIFGFTMTNDVSARDVMDAEPLQITLCKCPDTFAPIGPHITTVDEVGDVNAAALTISTHVNGVVKQRTTTDTMIHSIPALVEFLTRTVTMRPGDIMSTGTCGGTGVGRDPQEFMHPGDTVTVAVDRVGALTNPLVAGWAG